MDNLLDVYEFLFEIYFNLMDRCRRFGLTCCLHPEGNLKFEVTSSFESFVSINQTTRRQICEDVNINIHRREKLQSHISAFRFCNLFVCKAVTV
jgi:hypothetical protein